jgi:hypothetical protein
MVEPDETWEGENAVGSEGVGRLLPVGRHALPREFVVRSQRDRMLDAMAQICATGVRRGHGRGGDRERGGVPADVLDQFRDREECFLTAYDAILAQFLGRVLAAYGQAGLDWPGRMRDAIAPLLSFLAAGPAFARMCIVEVLASGERALERSY